MSPTTVKVVWVVVTFLVAGLTPLTIDLLDPAIGLRTMLAHVISGELIALTALLKTMPKVEWTEEVRAEKRAEKLADVATNNKGA